VPPATAFMPCASVRTTLVSSRSALWVVFFMPG
jgi:hypothetical protein